MGPQKEEIAVRAPGNAESVRLSVSPTKLVLSVVSGVEPAPQRNEGGQTLASAASAMPGETDQSAMCFRDTGKSAILSEAVKLGPVEQRKLAGIKEGFADEFDSNKLSAGQPLAERPAHRIELFPGAASSYVPRYRKLNQHEGEVERQANELLKKGKLQEPTSAFGHNPVWVRKKDGRWRVCVSFKPSNKITVKRKSPMPRMDELPDRLQGSAVYSAFGFTGAFLQIAIHPDDRHKTAFRTHARKLKYTCMPFKLINAPAELQRQVKLDFEEPIN